ncbi:MAG: replication-associated recombination protein A [Nitrospinae bacterium]|nr:replication-associated recombination protein A [Nitrospinota bacterium]
MDLFENSSAGKQGGPPKPLAERMRPKALEEFVGQEALLGPGKPLRALIEGGALPSIIFWGPPGSGKTTLARIIAQAIERHFIEISAVAAGVAELRDAVNSARREWDRRKRRTILFIDEVHRFNKTQQDAILPHVEAGEITIIGSTTENPAFEVIPALRSRLRIFRLERLTFDEVAGIVRRALDEQELDIKGRGTILADGAAERIAELSGGDARAALNLLESAVYASTTVDVALIDELSKDTSIMYDKQGQEHFDHASAFQKSLRGSDPDAAIYWLAKMIAGGEDPRFIARRLMVTASEDVGLADPTALILAVAAAEAVERLGMPEGRIPLAHAVLHVATAPKSNSAITAIDSALADIRKEGKSLPTPDHLKDTHYSAAKGYGFGKGYQYPHNFPGHYVKQDYMPGELKGRVYYEPTGEGREAAIAERMRRLKHGGQEWNDKSGGPK